MANASFRRKGPRRETVAGLGATGAWFRANDYELVPGPLGQTIAPCKGTDQETVDTWEGWSSRRGRRDFPLAAELAGLAPYLGELVELSEGSAVLPARPGARLSLEGTEAVLGFVRRWGLLGTALGEVVRLRLPEGRWWRTGGLWRHSAEGGGDFEVERLTIRGMEVEQDPWWWGSHTRPTRWRGQWHSKVLSPFSDEWHASYAEPASEFLLQAHRLSRALDGLGPDTPPEAFDFSRKTLARMAGHVSAVLERDDDGAIVQRWACGTLLETIGFQVLLDADERPLKRCPFCGGWFRQLADVDVQFCSPSCQRSGWKRDQRKKRGRPRGRPRKGNS